MPDWFPCQLGSKKNYTWKRWHSWLKYKTGAFIVESHDCILNMLYLIWNILFYILLCNCCFLFMLFNYPSTQNILFFFMSVPHTKTFYAVFKGRTCYCISSLRSKRANSKVITVVGIKIDQKYFLNVLLQKMQLPEGKRPGQVSAALTSVSCGLKTLHTG